MIYGDIPTSYRKRVHVIKECRGLAFRDMTVGLSIERLETTIMHHVGGTRETNTTVLLNLSVSINAYTLMKTRCSAIAERPRCRVH